MNDRGGSGNDRVEFVVRNGGEVGDRDDMGGLRRRSPILLADDRAKRPSAPGEMRDERASNEAAGTGDDDKSFVHTVIPADAGIHTGFALARGRRELCGRRNPFWQSSAG